MDDGLATGSTMLAAIRALRQQHPTRLVMAVPTAPPQASRDMKVHADEAVCAIIPEPFYSVGYWYEDFAQVTDDDVRDLLERSGSEIRVSSAGHHR